MCILLLYAPGHAFFCADDPSEELRIDHTPYESPVQGNNPLMDAPLKLYDNFVYTDPVYFLSRGQDGFVFVDQVFVDMPLRLLSKKNIIPENAIDRMLVSNLRIKAIVEKYKQLQIQAMALLQTNRAADSPKSVPENGITNKNPSGKRTDDIQKEKQKLGRILRGITQSTNVPAKKSAGDPIIVSDTYFSGGKSPQPGSRNLTDDAKISSGSSQPFDADFSRPANVLLNQPDTSLPWIFDRFLKIWKFVLEHRIEIITYMMFILLAGFFVSLRVKK